MDTVAFAPGLTPVLESLLFALQVANNRLSHTTGKHNERLSNSLEAFLARMHAECVEGRVPLETWLRDLKQLSDAINEHVATCDRHVSEMGALALLTSILDNARAKQLRKDVEQLKSSMDFTAAPASTPTSS